MKKLLKSRFLTFIAGVLLAAAVTVPWIVHSQQSDTQMNLLNGIPFLENHPNVTTGKVFWVSSTSAAKADDPANGKHPLLPFSTINYAISQMTASNGDTLYIMPGHAETITAAAGILVNKAGLRFVGLGVGANQPTISYSTAAGASFRVTSANFSIENVTFALTGFAALTSPIELRAADITMRNCRIVTGNATNQAVLGVLTTAAATRLTIDSCFFESDSTAGTTAAVRIVGGDRITIKNSIFVGAYTAGVGAIQGLTTDTTNCYIAGNYVDNRTALSTKAMVFTAASTGMIMNNRMQILSGTAPITAAGMSWVGGNYYSNALATAGTLI